MRDAVHVCDHRRAREHRRRATVTALHLGVDAGDDEHLRGEARVGHRLEDCSLLEARARHVVLHDQAMPVEERDEALRPARYGRPRLRG